MSMYNLLEYGKNYSMTSGSLWNYCRDEIDGVDDNASDGKSFEYKTKIVGKTAQITSLDLPLINCEIELDLKWAKNCVIDRRR